MSGNKKLVNGIIAVALIALGLVLGVNWGSARICLGDRIFLALGLSAWSNGTSGTHYPAIIGSCFILVGIGVFNSALQEKMRTWIRTIGVLLLVAVYFLLAFL